MHVDPSSIRPPVTEVNCDASIGIVAESGPREGACLYEPEESVEMSLQLRTTRPGIIDSALGGTFIPLFGRVSVSHDALAQLGRCPPTDRRL